MSAMLARLGMPGTPPALAMPSSLRLGSYAIISARRSRIGCLEGGTVQQTVFSNNLSWGVRGPRTYLRYCFVVDVDQVPRSWVDLEALVECQRRFESARCCVTVSSQPRDPHKAMAWTTPRPLFLCHTHGLRPTALPSSPGLGSRPPSPPRSWGSPLPWPRPRRP